MVSKLRKSIIDNMTIREEYSKLQVIQISHYLVLRAFRHTGFRIWVMVWISGLLVRNLTCPQLTWRWLVICIKLH